MKKLTPYAMAELLANKKTMYMPDGRSVIYVDNSSEVDIDADIVIFSNTPFGVYTKETESKFFIYHVETLGELAKLIGWLNWKLSEEITVTTKDRGDLEIQQNVDILPFDKNISTIKDVTEYGDLFYDADYTHNDHIKRN